MPAASYARATLRSRWQTEVEDPGGVRATSAVFADLLNDAGGDWCEQSRTRLHNWQIDIVANQAAYSLTGLEPRCIEILRASCPTGSGQTNDLELVLRTQTEMDAPGIGFPNWRSQAASWPHTLIRDIQGPQSLRLYPTPLSSQAATVMAGTIFANQLTGGLVDISGLTSVQATALTGSAVDVQFLCGSLQLYGIAHSTDISDDSTTVETAFGISPDYQDALLWYCAARFFEMRVPIAQAAKADRYWAKWQSELSRATSLEKRSFQTRPPRATRKRYF